MASATEHKTLCKEWVNRKYGVTELPQDIEAVHQLITSVDCFITDPTLFPVTGHLIP
ncbi:hypothetical protein SynBIOSE41_01785 [Synechococcus sp. BIOS-E4-1]|nr:hypothetical protein SynBIOSE41_01785 [Synechococcus sp. BIOS-E4-1]